MGVSRAHARFRDKGKGGPPRPPDPGRKAAQEACERSVLKLMPSIGKAAPTIVDTVLAVYILERAKQAFADEDIKRALTSERPWDMVRLIDKTPEETAAIAGILPVVGEIVGEMDPTGSKPFFAYSRDEVMRLFEAVIFAWEEAKGSITVDVSKVAMTERIHADAEKTQAFYDDEIPF